MPAIPIPLLALTGGEFRDFLGQALPVLFVGGCLLGVAMFIAGALRAYREYGLRVVSYWAIIVAAPAILYVLGKFLCFYAIILLLQLWGAHLPAARAGALTFNQSVGAGCITRFHSAQNVVRPLAPLVADTQRRDVAFKCLARFFTN